MDAELTTVADDEVVVHVGPEVRRYRGLEPATAVRLDGIDAVTLARPPGRLLSVVATVNDTHFGEVECGRVEGTEFGPVLTADPGEPPYPLMMNEAVVAEIGMLRRGAGPDAVVAKGDLTSHGASEEYAAFRAVYATAFGPRLFDVRGNHDAVEGGVPFAAEPMQEVVLPGVRLAILDTAVPGQAWGRLGAVQLAWLDELGARADRPVLVFGHHPPWDPDSGSRPEVTFGLDPDDSEALVAVMARRPRLVGWFAGHTHRNRVRRFAKLGGRPMVEVASVKDFPGSWVEYRVFEGGILQIQRRASSREALTWTDRTRAMFFGKYVAYSFGAIEDRCFVVTVG